jgi:hypothetical protein
VLTRDARRRTKRFFKKDGWRAKATRQEINPLPDDRAFDRSQHRLFKENYPKPEYWHKSQSVPQPNDAEGKNREAKTAARISRRLNAVGRLLGNNESDHCIQSATPLEKQQKGGY